jgi:hypothetical protein
VPGRVEAGVIFEVLWSGHGRVPFELRIGGVGRVRR